MITIVTDSTAYLKKKHAEQLGVKIVPVNYVVGDKDYCESFSDCNGNFEALLRSKERFATSHPNPSVYLNCFEGELNAGNEILCITMSSRLSGTNSAAHTAAKQLASSKIAICDSLLTAGGLLLLIEEARKLIDEGLTLSEVLAKMNEIRNSITIAFSVEDMTPLRNSGRIGFVRMSVGTILNLRPILLCKDGVVVSDCVVHGTTELIKQLTQKVKDDSTEVIINYIENSRIAANLYNVIKGNHPNINVRLQRVGPVLGIHLGLEAVAVSVK